MLLDSVVAPRGRYAASALGLKATILAAAQNVHNLHVGLHEAHQLLHGHTLLAANSVHLAYLRMNALMVSGAILRVLLSGHGAALTASEHTEAEER